MSFRPLNCHPVPFAHHNHSVFIDLVSKTLIRTAAQRDSAMSRNRYRSLLIEALADKQQHDKRLLTDLTSSPEDLRREGNRIETRISEFASFAGVSRFELDDFDDEVRAVVRQRRSVQRKRNRSAFETSFADMMLSAGVR